MNIFLEQPKVLANVDRVTAIASAHPHWVDESGEFDDTPLHLACRAGYSNTVKALVSMFHAHINARI